MTADRWNALASSNARCGQFFLVMHHALLLPSIVVPAAVSLFEATSNVLKYTVVGASAATALSLALKLELRSFVHSKASREYMLLALDNRASQEEVKQRITQLLREAPLLPSCFCATVKGNGRIDPPAGDSGEARTCHV